MVVWERIGASGYSRRLHCLAGASAYKQIANSRVLCIRSLAAKKGATEMASEIIATRPSSTNKDISTILNGLKRKKIEIDDFQRAGRQWNEAKKSLFIESILCNLLVPAFVFADEKREEGMVSKVVDGQQRLEALQDFYHHNMRLAEQGEASYNLDTASYYAGKTFSELDEVWRDRFLDYNITIMIFPETSKSIRREVFRRINEGGVPVSPQDLRLASFFDSKTVRFIRLVGIHNPGDQGVKDVLANAGADSIPWGYSGENMADQLWYQWWQGKQITVGQTASEMFLWFLVSYSLQQLNNLLQNANLLRKEFNQQFNDRTEEVLDIYCAAVQVQDSTGEKTYGLPSYEETLELFGYFQTWFNVSATKRIARPDRYRNLAIFIGGAKRYDIYPHQLNREGWDLLKKYCNNMTKFSDDFGIELPPAHGRWKGSREKQLQNINQVITKIVGN